MSEAAAAPAPEAAGGEGQKPAKKSGGMLPKIIALVFMLTVVVTECFVGYVWFFSPSDSAVAAKEHEDEADTEEAHAKEEAHGHGEASHGGEGEHGKKEEKAHGEGEHAGAHGGGKSEHGAEGHGGGGHGGGHGEEGKPKKPLGEYVEVDLGKYNVMAYQPGANAMRVIEFHLYGAIASESHGAFERLWEENQQRCRDQVIVTIRSSEVEDFTDPSLGLIKRKILARTNDVLGKPLLEEVVFSDFSFIEE